MCPASSDHPAKQRLHGVPTTTVEKADTESDIGYIPTKNAPQMQPIPLCLNGMVNLHGTVQVLFEL